MKRGISTFVLAGALMALLPGGAFATTREIADLQPARLTFDRSILNQLTYDTYRDPFDELQTRPYNLLFQNIGRHANLSPWQGQAGSYTRYFNALIGNNGTANVDNDADSIQGSLIRRESAAFAWGVSAAMLAGTDGSNDTIGTSTFADTDDLNAFDVRLSAARQTSERRVLGAGLRLTQATTEETNRSFEPGVGGFFGLDGFDQFGFAADFGMRHFHTPTRSWEAQIMVSFDNFEQDELSESIDDTGAVTDRFVITNYDITDLDLGFYFGYNRLRPDELGETELRFGIERSQRELDNANLAFDEAAGVVTPNLTLLGQDTISATRVHLSAKTIFPAGETEMFTGAQLAYSMQDGATQVDNAGVVLNEAVDDTQLDLGLTVGVRQRLFSDKIRFVISGRADLMDGERGTIFETSTDIDDSSLSTSRYAIGLEGVLSNVTFDIAWLVGDEAAVVPVPLGFPSGSRRTVELDRLVFSAGVAW